MALAGGGGYEATSEEAAEPGGVRLAVRAPKPPWPVHIFVVVDLGGGGTVVSRGAFAPRRGAAGGATIVAEEPVLNPGGGVRGKGFPD